VPVQLATPATREAAERDVVYADVRLGAVKGALPSISQSFRVCSRCKQVCL
jgi:hypothetical protein